MRFLIILLLGWGVMASGGNASVTGTQAEAGIFGDVDTRCAMAMAWAAKAEAAKNAMARVLVVDEIPMNRDLYTTIFHSGAVPRFFEAVRNLPDGNDATIRWHIEQRSLDSFAPSSFAEPERGSPDAVFVYTVANLDEAAAALNWAKRNGLYFDLAVTAGVFPESTKDIPSQQFAPAAPFEWLFNPRSQRGLSERQRPNGIPVFDLIDDIRKSDARTRVVVCSNWDERTVQEYSGRPHRGRTEFATPDSWYVLAVVPHLLVYELWKSMQAPK